MAFELRPNNGSLFINEKKTAENHPDLKGTINVDGVVYWLSAWQKTGNKGQFYSLSVSPKENRNPAPQAQPAPAKPLLGQPTLDDEVPF